MTFSTSIKWALDATNLTAQIPDWAESYAVVMTKCIRTRSFLQARASNMTYVTKDVDGVYDSELLRILTH